MPQSINVELPRIADQLHRRIVYIHVGHLDFGVLLRKFDNRVSPENHGGQYIRLVDGGNLFTAFHGCVEGDAADLFDFIFCIDHRIEGLIAVVAFRLTKVYASCQLPDDENIETAAYDFAFQRRSVFQLGKDDGRPEVCEEFEYFPDGKEGSPLRLLIRGKRLPLGSADGTEKDSIGSLACFNSTFGKRFTMVVDGNTADIGMSIGECNLILFRNSGKNLFRFRHDFGTDSVSRKDGNIIAFHKHSFISLHVIISILRIEATGYCTFFIDTIIQKRRLLGKRFFLY